MDRIVVVERYRPWLLFAGSLWALKLLLAGHLAGFLLLVAMAFLLPGSWFGVGQTEEEEPR